MNTDKAIILKRKRRPLIQKKTFNFFFTNPCSSAFIRVQLCFLGAVNYVEFTAATNPT